jgi:hypothetical protein
MYYFISNIYDKAKTAWKKIIEIANYYFLSKNTLITILSIIGFYFFFKFLISVKKSEPKKETTKSGFQFYRNQEIYNLEKVILIERKIDSLEAEKVRIKAEIELKNEHELQKELNLIFNN